MQVWWYGNFVNFVHKAEASQACEVAARLLYGAPLLSYNHGTPQVSRCGVCGRWLEEGKEWQK